MFNIVSIDIETSEAPLELLEEEIKTAIVKITRRKVKEYKTDARQQQEIDDVESDYQKKIEEKREALIEKSGLSLHAPIACIGMYTDTGHKIHLSTFDFTPEEVDTLSSDGIFTLSFKSEAMMMCGLSCVLDTFCTQETTVVAHNGWSFDYPRIRLAYARNDVTIHQLLRWENKYNCLDSMHLFSQYSGDNFSSLSNMCQSLRIPFSKLMTGAEVPVAIKNKKFVEVTQYNILDCMSCYLAYIKMLTA